LEGISREEADIIASQRRRQLETEFEAAQRETYRSDRQSLGGYWEGFFGGPPRPDDEVDTAVAAGKLSFVMQKIAAVPHTFRTHPKLARMLEGRREMAEGRRPVDWATAELAAFGTLALEGHRVRLSGQDSRRGTFSQRHAVLYDAESGEPYAPLQHLSDDQAPVEIINSPLSEAGVLGFEYGYSLDQPESLVAWEAQFGDFWNAGQVIFDQFISSAEEKWRRLSGLTMLLPHGFEGAGPEHCSARLERFLMLAAQHNFQVTQPTTAAQYFHLLRRQVKRRWRKPLVVLTPKGMLREPRYMSELAHLTRGKFQAVLADPGGSPETRPDRILLATGKIAAELLDVRDRQRRDDIAIVRLEQLYPFPQAGLEEVLSVYPDGTLVTWVQEEPCNMGAWTFIKMNLGDSIGGRWPLAGVISRPESASPSTGSKKTHKLEQEEIVSEALRPAAVPVAR
jgi:2-oxoglutarate dehydrogenase E1 component